MKTFLFLAFIFTLSAQESPFAVQNLRVLQPNGQLQIGSTIFAPSNGWTITSINGFLTKSVTANGPQIVISPLTISFQNGLDTYTLQFPDADTCGIPHTNPTTYILTHSSLTSPSSSVTNVANLLKCSLNFGFDSTLEKASIALDDGLALDVATYYQ